jgi:hypothetical protein
MKRYYTLGGQRVAVRSGAPLSWLFSDHLGSTSVRIALTERKASNPNDRIRAINTLS